MTIAIAGCTDPESRSPENAFQANREILKKPNTDAGLRRKSRLTASGSVPRLSSRYRTGSPKVSYGTTTNKAGTGGQGVSRGISEADPVSIRFESPWLHRPDEFGA